MINNEELRDGAYGLSLIKKTALSTQLRPWVLVRPEFEHTISRTKFNQRSSPVGGQGFTREGVNKQHWLLKVKSYMKEKIRWRH